MGDNNINSSGGNGNPAEPFPTSLNQYSTGEWSFTEINNGLLNDLSTFKNNLRVENITQIYPSKNLPFFVVTSTADDADASIGDGNATSLNGSVTLRSALQETNSLAGQQTIYFYIQGAGPYSIIPNSPLPIISDAVFLDGTSQKGYSGFPVVGTNGTYGGIEISSGSSTVQGLSLNSSSDYGLKLISLGNNNIKSNKISGISISSSLNNINSNTISNSFQDGIKLTSGGMNNKIGVVNANNISNNSGFGISISGVNGNQIAGNNIAINVAGGISLYNSEANISGNNITSNSGTRIKN